MIQAIWVASISSKTNIKKPLYADAGSGIIFNLFGKLEIGNETLEEGVIMLPVKHKAAIISMAPNTKLAGIRFHPAIGFGVLGQHYDKPTQLKIENDTLYNLFSLYSKLKTIKSDKQLIDSLHQWCETHLDFVHIIPDSLEQALDDIEQTENLEPLKTDTGMSHRQVERYFKHWLGMTPKYYQRVLRIKKAMHFLRSNPNSNLADVAYQFGFSDQAHMTREFQSIAGITPKKICAS